MEDLGFYFWIIITLPVWLTLTILWIVIKLLFQLVIYFIFVITFQYDSVTAMISGLLNSIVRPFLNLDLFYDEFEQFYYEHTFFAILIGFVVFLAAYNSNSPELTHKEKEKKEEKID